MDKETLSHYGWIVILVLILAVLLALASPFGSFIAGAIKSTTAGLFDVNQAALGSAGINVDDLVFENCDHLETEVRNVSDTYTGDTCCKACGAVLQAGQKVRAKVPEGGLYTAADGTVYNPGDEMPETATTGDTYTYHWYVYKYNQRATYTSWETVESQNGWGVHVDTNIGGVTDYGEMLHTINGKPIVSLRYAFDNCHYMTTVPTIPDTVTDMGYAFYACPKITTAPVIPEGVIDMERAFQGCTSLTNEGLPSIPSTVTNMKGTFSGCSSLTNIDSIKIPAGVTSLESTFASCGAIDATNFIIPNTVTDMSYTFAYGKIVKAPIIPSSVTKMQYTFDSCSSLVGLPDLSEATGLTTMFGTFRSCTAITDASKLVIPSNVTTIDSIFSGCTGLTVAPDLSKANALTDMGMTFSGCTSLKSMPEIPNSVKRMERTFWNCKSLETVSALPNGVTNISYAFQNCTSLTDLSTFVIPSSLTSMSYTFSGCTSLTTAPVIPSTVLNKNELFSGCTSLTGTITLNCYPANSSNMFSGVDFETQNLTLIGSYVDTFGATGTNYCAECNGKCNGGH